MKIVLETIPVWDSLKENKECLLCSLMKKAEEDSVRYYLSSAIMTPEVRVETNKVGFCPHHLNKLAFSGNPQSLALTLHTYYEENEKVFSSSFESIKKSKNYRSVKRNVEAFEKKAKEREKGCLICRKMSDRQYRYAFTIISLFTSDEDFRKAFLSSKGLCLLHTLETAKVDSSISQEEKAIFLKELFALLERNLLRVKDDDYWMTQKYKSENQDKPWNGCEDAQRRAALKLIGEGRIYEKE